MLLYLHIPFCHRICPYCSFYKHTPGQTSIGRFIDALVTESAARIASSGQVPRTIYLGGGTPSMLSPAHLTKLFQGLKESIDFTQLDDVTMEANPATFDEKKAALFTELGVTRTSLGIQSFAPHVLKTLGREHTPEEASASVDMLRRTGMRSINIDLMFSIPGQSLEDWKQTLQTAVSLEPQHISAYNLTYEEDTAFFESLRKGEMSQNEDHDADHFHLADELLTQAGFDHYETSNYAQPDHHSTHNQGYWSGEDYLGLGPSAVSTVGMVRHKNIPDTAHYVSQIESIGNAIHESETIDEEAWRLERIALGLRTKEGIPLTLLDSEGKRRALTLAEEGLAEMTETSLILVQRGRALVDPIAAELV
ncbi:radical SAM family heme chaperone HemW [Luteolibacter pohnpeiensis]|uniref:radical SAM family heme chaperone HemW n=1 Tax=Luteolibacter pohnpeiensis TaxID=454153 RepID=UPI003CCD7F58